MPRFFISTDAVADGRVDIDGADAAHLTRSLRARPGEEVVVVDEAGVEHGVRLERVAADRCSGTVAWSRPSSSEPRLRITVLQAIPQQSMEEAIDAMVQAGVGAIVPVVTARSVVRLDPARASRRLERWRAVAREAAALAHRGRVPDIAEVAGLDAGVAALGAGYRRFVADPDAAVPIGSPVIDAGVRAAVVIGPEGGLTQGELDRLTTAGFEPVHLGPRVFRARLAGALATTLLLAAAGDLGRSTEPPPDYPK